MKTIIATVSENVLSATDQENNYIGSIEVDAEIFAKPNNGWTRLNKLNTVADVMQDLLETRICSVMENQNGSAFLVNVPT